MPSRNSNNSNAVEVDGIRFETLVPERLLVIPNQSGDKTPVQFGIRVTNLSPTPYRFTSFYLLPELLEPDGQAIKMGYARNATRAPQESDFLLAMPGESLTFFMDAEFYWFDCKLRLAGEARDGGFWHFDDLKPGKYRVRFTYRNQSAVKQILYGGTIEGLWTGIVSTSFVEFRLSIYI